MINTVRQMWTTTVIQTECLCILDVSSVLFSVQQHSNCNGAAVYSVTRTVVMLSLFAGVITKMLLWLALIRGLSENY